MSRITAAAIGPPQSSTTGNDLRDVDLGQFLKLLITELQNQDPLDPMDNSEIVQQLSQIREIGATNLLTETLQSIRDGQNLATASSLIGKEIVALTDSGQEVRGIVKRVSMETEPGGSDIRTLRVHIGDQAIQLDNIREVLGGQDV